jgi:hypothetical protein
MDHCGGDPSGEHGGPSSGQTSGQRMVPDEGTMKVLEAVNLVMRQQQAAQRREALATKALHSVVNRLDQFDRRNISRYIQFYIREMELSRVSEEEMVASFEFTVISEIRKRVHEL